MFATGPRAVGFTIVWPEGVIFRSMMTYHVQFLLLVLAGWVNRQQQDVIDYLQEENRVLRAGLRGKRLSLPAMLGCFVPVDPTPPARYGARDSTIGKPRSRVQECRHGTVLALDTYTSPTANNVVVTPQSRKQSCYASTSRRKSQSRRYATRQESSRACSTRGKGSYWPERIRCFRPVVLRAVRKS